MADLYTFTLSGGAVHRYSGTDETVTLGGRTFALGPLLTRGGTRIGPGIAVDELDLTVSADPGVALNGRPLVDCGDCDVMDDTQRAAVMAETLTWINAPYHHHGRVKGVAWTARICYLRCFARRHKGAIRRQDIRMVVPTAGRKFAARKSGR